MNNNTPQTIDYTTLRAVIQSLPLASAPEALELSTQVSLANGPENVVTRLSGPFPDLFSLNCAKRYSVDALEFMCDVADAEGGVLVDSIELVSGVDVETVGRTLDLMHALGKAVSS